MAIPSPKSADESTLPVRICILIDNLRLGGTEMRLLRLIERYDRGKVTPVLCLLDGTSSLSQSLEPECPVYRLGIKSLLRFSTIGKLVRLFRILRRHKIDLVELYFRDSTAVGVPLGWLAGAKCVATFFSEGYWVRWYDRIMFFLYKPFIHRMISNCQSASDAGQKLAFIAKRKCQILENGIDLEAYRTIRDSQIAGPYHIGMVSNLRPVKNPMLLVKAARILRDQRTDLRFSIAGDGELRQALQDTIDREGLSGCFELIGSVTSVPKYLETVSIAVNCSHSEGMSNSLIEYMAAGKPIVATRVGGNPELIPDTKSGLLVDDDDAAQLAEAILELIDDPKRASAMGARCRELAMSKYGLESMTRRFENFYMMCKTPTMGDDGRIQTRQELA